jgi:hypothetical protein
MKLPAAVVQSFIFLKLAIAGHLTIFVTRTVRRFWQRPYPAPLLFWGGNADQGGGNFFCGLRLVHPRHRLAICLARLGLRACLVYCERFHQGMGIQVFA